MLSNTVRSLGCSLVRAVASGRPATIARSPASRCSSTDSSEFSTSDGFSAPVESYATQVKTPLPLHFGGNFEMNTLWFFFQSARGAEKCINQVTLLGRVGQEPQVRGTDAHPVVTFSLATNYRFAQLRIRDCNCRGCSFSLLTCDVLVYLDLKCKTRSPEISARNNSSIIPGSGTVPQMR